MSVIEISRYEFKYLLTPGEVPEVRRFLLRYCTPDDNARGLEWYGIESLYLDTPDYRFFRASAQKEYNRLKLRVRAYANGGGPVKFEIKRRAGDLVTKRSLLVPRPAWERFAVSGTAAEFAFLVENFHAAPKLLVHYERQAFHSVVDDYVRVTFDRRIRCQATREWSLDGAPQAWHAVDRNRDSSSYVLEVKFQLAAPAWLRDMVATFGLERRGFSKYVRGVRQAVFGQEPAWGLRPVAAAPGLLGRVA